MKSPDENADAPTDSGIVAAAVTAGALMGAGIAVLGQATFKAWLGSIATVQMLLEQGGLPWQKMPTVFALVRLLHAPVRVAYGLHIAVAIAAAVLVWRVWRRSQDWQLRGAVLMAATFLISPYVFDYDLVWLAFPIAWLALVGVRDGWMRGERELLTLAWVLPLLMAPIASTTSRTPRTWGRRPGPAASIATAARTGRPPIRGSAR